MGCNCIKALIGLSGDMTSSFYLGGVFKARQCKGWGGGIRGGTEVLLSWGRGTLPRTSWMI